MTFRADLHCHSLFSDGSLSPEQLVLLAKQRGLSALSITDHDTYAAYDRAIPAAKEAGLILGTGIEFSCVLSGCSVHILGYDYRLPSSSLAEFCEKHKWRRKERNKEIIERLKARAIFLTEEEVERIGPESDSIGRPHIAKLMLQKGYVKTFKEAFELYLGDGRSCYVPGTPFSIEETMQVLRKAEGKVFIAHPHLIQSRKLILELLDLKFDGIECYYGRCSSEKEKRWLKIAEKKQWLISGGSDFHGETKQHVSLGCSWVNRETFNTIFSHAYV